MPGSGEGRGEAVEQSPGLRPLDASPLDPQLQPQF